MDLSGIPPVPLKKIVMVRFHDDCLTPFDSTHTCVQIINQFIVRSSKFINQFSSLCELKLQAVDSKLQRTEIVLSLLEAKLKSISWLEMGGAAAPEAAVSPAAASPAPAPEAAPSEPAVGADAPPAPPPLPGTVVATTVSPFRLNKGDSVNRHF